MFVNLDDCPDGGLIGSVFEDSKGMVGAGQDNQLAAIADSDHRLVKRPRLLEVHHAVGVSMIIQGKIRAQSATSVGRPRQTQHQEQHW